MDEGRITSAYEEELELEGEGRDEEVVSGDVGIALVVRRACITPRVADNRWLRCNIFQSTCTVKNKVCKFLIDAGSCENIISTEAVSKLGLVTEQHPRPYRLAWLKKGGEISVSKRSLVTFSVGTQYQDKVWCDIVTMETCHLLLGQPWQFDRDVTHNGRSNTYNFLHKGIKITLIPSKEEDSGELLEKDLGPLSLACFEKEMWHANVVYALGCKGTGTTSATPTIATKIIEEFCDVFPEELLAGLPPLRDIQHQIDLLPWSALPNKAHYRMSPREHEELRSQVEQLIAKGFIRESMSPCAVPALLVPKKDGAWRMCVDSRAINKIFTGYRFPIFVADIIKLGLSRETSGKPPSKLERDFTSGQ